jgi:uncharacterized membrane protein YgdD (TMEM256/DUF423 family)
VQQLFQQLSNRTFAIQNHQDMNKAFIWATFFGFTGIVLGALGAHALKQILDPEQLRSFETGVRYQLYHALFLLAVGILDYLGLLKGSKWIIRSTVLGVFFFSFSIYLLNLQEYMGIKLGFLGPVTPLGGLLLMCGWALFLVGIYRSSKPNQ